MNTERTEPPRADSSKFLIWTKRRWAQVSSWLVVILSGLLLSTVLYNTIFKFIYQPLMKSSVLTPKSTQADEEVNTRFVWKYFNYYGDSLLNNFLCGCMLGFSIALVIGVQRKVAEFILAWFVYNFIFFGIFFTRNVLDHHYYTYKEKILLLRLFLLLFMLYGPIFLYFKELRRQNTQDYETSDVTVTIANPIQPHLQNQSFQQYYQFKNNIHVPTPSYPPPPYSCEPPTSVPEYQKL